MGEERTANDLTAEVNELRRRLDDQLSTLSARAGRRPTGMLEPWPYALTAAPAGTLPCDGRTVLRKDYPDLWSVVSAKGGVVAGGGLFTAGDGSTNFRVPDLRGRALVGAGQLGGAGPAYALGAVGGAESVTLTVAQLPAHDHPASGETNDAGSHAGHFNGSQFMAQSGPDYGLAAWNSSGQSRGGHSHNVDVTVGARGDGAAHENRPPFVVVNWLVWC